MPLRTLAVALVIATGLSLLSLGLYDSRAGSGSIQVVHAAAPATTPVPRPTAAPPTAPDELAAAIRAAVGETGGRAGVDVVDLGGPAPREFRFAADDQFTAASTYKVPALMDEAERIADGEARPADRLCYRSSEAEDGWFDDYTKGTCLSVQDVADRVGTYSDNTAAHMLVDALGGGDVLNSYARSRGARESAFYDPNVTTASDLAALWTTEATGGAGGSAAQQWLYPFLTHTRFEAGLPAGVPASATVVHKVGMIDDTVNDAGIVSDGSTRYVVAVATDGLGGDAGWALVARISALVWSEETAH